MLRLPFLHLSYPHDHPFNVSPLSVDINITDRCNFRCKQCRGSVDNYESLPEMDINAMRGIIDDMSRMHIPYLTLAGGEPLLRYDFVLETIKYARTRKIRVGIVTNGWLLNRAKLIELADVGLHRLAFSLDGATSEVHDSIRTQGSFDRIISSLSICSELKRKDRFRLHINTVVMKPNFRQLLDVARIAQEYGATAFYQPIGVSQKFERYDNKSNPFAEVRSLIIDNDEIGNLEVEIRKLIDFKIKRGVIGNLQWQLLNIVEYFKSLQNSTKRGNFKCFAAFNTVHLESNGDFSSCFFMPSLGNIQNMGLKSAWTDKKYTQQRKAVRMCTRPCQANCYYPISLQVLSHEFLYLPGRRYINSLFHQ